MPTVLVEGVGKIAFPDSMSPDEIKGAIQNDILPKAQASGSTDPSAVSQIGQGAGLGVRSLIKGAMALPNMALDAGIGIGNLVNKGTNALGLTDAGSMPSASSLTERALTALGFPEPGTTAQSVLSDVGSALSGAGALSKTADVLSSAGPIASSVQQRVLSALAQQPSMQAASSVAGTLSADAAREAGLGPVGQTAAGMVGGIVPGAAKYAGAATLRGTIRGSDPTDYNQRLSDFQAAGVDPSATQTGGRVAQAFGSVLAKVPGGAGPMTAQAEQEAAQMADKVNSIADALVPNANTTKAGAVIERGLKNFVQRFKGEQDFLYSKLDQHIPDQTPVQVDNTLSALKDLNADIPGAPELSKWFKNAKIQGIEGAMTDDVAANPSTGNYPQVYTPGEGNGTLPYEAVKKLRTLVGGEISNNSIASDVPRSKWNALYAALSTDMEGAAQQAGSDATAAFNRANWFTRAGYDRIETILDRVGGKDTAEKVYQAAVNPSETQQGATTINAVMRSLSPEERQMVTATTVKRLGLASAGNQDVSGQTFSPSTFLTNWNKISPEARMVLFPDDNTRNGLAALAQATDYIKQGAKVFANPSGTSAGAASVGAIVGAAVNPALAVKIAAGVAAASGAARLMNNPAFVQWVGKATQMSPGTLPGMLQGLAQMSQNWTPAERGEAQSFITGASSGS